MELPQPLIRGRLVRRYKRFLADVALDESGETVVAHVANSGSMAGLSDPGLAVWLSRSSNPKRKLGFSWELVELEDGRFSGVDAARPNKLVAEALAAGGIAEVATYPNVRAEARYGENSRVDFLLTGDGLPDCYLEVKNVHMRRRADLAEFPDAVTARGAKHLGELAKRVAAGDRAILLYCVQRDDCARLALAADYDPAYVAAHAAAAAAGVETLVYGCRFTPPPHAAIVLDRRLPMAEDDPQGDADAHQSSP